MAETAPNPTLVWFRRDLRLADNPALREAVDRGGPVIPVFIYAPGEEGGWAPGGAGRWWLHHSLERLSQSLGERGSKLIVRTGPTLETLRDLIEKTGADTVIWNRLYDPLPIERDTEIKKALRSDGIDAQSRNGALLFEPWTIKSGSGDPYKVFTPFWRACQKELGEPDLCPRPDKIPAPGSWPATKALDRLGLLPEIAWDERFPERWTPGEAGAHEHLRRFLDESIDDYHQTRNAPGVYGTSRLSPHLHWGEISPRQIVHETRKAQGNGRMSKGAEIFLSEIGWREFAYHVLFNNPHTPEEPLRPEFKQFPWRSSQKDLRAWQRGKTGYPIVDAGMRELWEMGWMHNRVRMIVGSFLVKHLRIHWIEGERWFWDTLVDADLASNTLGWQWAAGCGADAAPYFRVFNPILQGEKFDPEGEYVREWVPEIASLPNKFLHKPWEAPEPVLRDAGVTLGETYPKPVVDHKAGREAALEAFQKVKKK